MKGALVLAMIGGVIAWLLYANRGTTGTATEMVSRIAPAGVNISRIGFPIYRPAEIRCGPNATCYRDFTGLIHWQPNCQPGSLNLICREPALQRLAQQFA